MAYKPRKRKVKKNVPEGRAYIKSTFNNTLVTLSDTEGNARVNARIILAGVNSSTFRRNSDNQYLNIGYAWKAYKILEIIEQNKM